jgi:hypothetical protein
MARCTAAPAPLGVGKQHEPRDLRLASIVIRVEQVDRDAATSRKTPLLVTIVSSDDDGWIRTTRSCCLTRTESNPKATLYTQSTNTSSSGKTPGDEHALDRSSSAA